MHDALTPLALDSNERARLRAGKVVQRAAGEDSTAPDFPLGLVCLPVPPASAWEVLAQWQRIREITSSLSFHVARETQDDAGVRHALIAAEVYVPLMTMRYTCRATFDARTWHQSWALVPAQELELLIKELPALPRQSWMLRESTGSIDLHRWDEGCVLVHRNRIVPRKGVPHTLEALLTKQLVREFLTGVRKFFLARPEPEAYGAACQSAGSSHAAGKIARPS